MCTQFHMNEDRVCTVCVAHGTHVASIYFSVHFSGRSNGVLHVETCVTISVCEGKLLKFFPPTFTRLHICTLL
jgi:hypothetical protein